MADHDFHLIPIPNRYPIQVPFSSLPKPKKRGRIFNIPLTTTALCGRKGSGKGVCIFNILADLVSGYPLIEKKPKIQSGEGFSLRMGSQEREDVKPILKFGIRGMASVQKQDEEKDDKKSYHRLLHVFIYSSTLHSDPIWKSIIDFLKKSGVRVTIYTSSYSDDGKINNLEVLRDYLQEQDLLRETNEDDDTSYEYCVILDDLSEEIKRNPYISALLKSSRHHSIRNLLLSTQDVKDLLPTSWFNIDNTLLFAKQNIERIQHFHDITGLDLPLPLFIEIWRDATRAKHNFLYVQVPEEKFYKNFSEEYIFT